jgi:hypothetical protein
VRVYPTLGGRSVIASSTRPGITERIKSAIKFREAFRPLAISGTREGRAQLVACDAALASLAPYMLAAGQVIDERRGRGERPALACFLADIVDPCAWLEERLGPLVRFEAEGTPVAGVAS